MSSLNVSRRSFLSAAAGTGALMMSNPLRLIAANDRPLYRISLAQWSLHKALFDKKIDNLDFAKVTKEEFGIDGVEYVNQFFFEKAKDTKYLDQMKKNAADAGVRSLLIMVDREGKLGDPNSEKREQAVDNHKKWVEAAAHLGCHSVRVNAASDGSWEEQVERAADGLFQLTEFAEQHNLSVIVENHGGLSSNGEWLSQVMKRVDHPHCGTLPDFGNFRVYGENWYDRYEGVEKLMPFAKAVSAKSYYFDEDGNDTRTDFHRVMKLVVESGYLGYVGIEYEGHDLDEYEGIRKTKTLLERVRDELSA